MAYGAAAQCGSSKSSSNPIVSGVRPNWGKASLTAPAKIPAAPIPAIVLPMMKTMEEGAAPQRADAAPNVKTLRISVYLIENKVKSFPNSSCREQHERRYALPYQLKSRVDWKSLVIWGIACDANSSEHRVAKDSLEVYRCRDLAGITYSGYNGPVEGYEEQAHEGSQCHQEYLPARLRLTERLSLFKINVRCSIGISL